MDRVVRLYQLWSWLPHFRAVAETEHLPTASEAFGVSTSALSRALKQLEEAVGQELFVRDRGSIRLNEHGEMLLRAVRYAMRSIDDAVVALIANEVPLTLRVAAPGPYQAVLVLPAVAAAKKENDKLRFKLSSVSPGEIVSSLCQGVVDVVIHEGAIEHGELVSVVLATVDNVVFAAPDHPIASVENVDVEELCRHPFAGPPRSPAGFCEDGWPAGTDRILGLTVSVMQMGIDASRSGEYLTVLPRRIGRGYGLVPIEVPDLGGVGGTELLTQYEFPGDDIPVIRGSALKAMEEDTAAEESVLELLAAMDDYIPMPERDVDKPFLMPVEDIFSISGRGTVVTGRVDRGKVHTGDEMEIVGIRPTIKRVVTGVEMFRKMLDEGQAGDNVGLLLRGTDKDDVERGQVVAAQGSITPHTKFKSEVYILTKEEGGRHTPFFNGYRPQFYFRTTDVTGDVLLPEGTEMVMPGDNVGLEVTLITPIAMEKGCVLQFVKVAERLEPEPLPRFSNKDLGGSVGQ